MCQYVCIEDEIHFLCVCPIYTNIQSGYYHTLNVNKNGGIQEEFQSIVCHENTNVLINFVYDLWMYRNGLLCKLQCYVKNKMFFVN